MTIHDIALCGSIQDGAPGFEVTCTCGALLLEHHGSSLIPLDEITFIAGRHVMSSLFPAPQRKDVT